MPYCQFLKYCKIKIVRKFPIFISFFIIVTSIVGLILYYQPQAYAAVQDEINARQKQIEELEKQIADYQQKIDQNKGLARTLENEVSKLNNQIQGIQLEIKSLTLAIDNTSLGIQETNDQIQTSLIKTDKLKTAIAEFIRFTESNDQISLVALLLKHNSISEFFNNSDAIRNAQEQAQINIQQLRNLKLNLENEREQLETQKEEQLRLKKIQELQKQSLASVKQSKDKILKDTKNQETRFQKLIQLSQKDITSIKNQITFLIQQGITVEDAIKYGQLAAIATGIRPAFLLAILEIESRLGQNVGTGNWLDDMYNCYLRLGRRDRAEAEKAALLQIVNKLNLDINTLKVSREPNYGCGGAMGPAQFIPTTWLGYESRVANLTGHNPPNPWNIEDAFTGASIKLAAGGATSKNAYGETRAAKAYVSGSPTCTRAICNSYARLVLQKAAEIEQDLINGQ
ncbi:MAG: lytic murein transglycosylase [Parcubacteria group bacterium]|nr:lytic murein transglycosylase [Parcubacteria group bacterium]